MAGFIAMGAGIMLSLAGGLLFAYDVYVSTDSSLFRF